MNRKAVGVAVAVVFGLGLLFLTFMDGPRSTAVAEAGEKPAGNGAPAPAQKAPEKAVTFDPASLPKAIASVNGTEIPRDTFIQIVRNIIGEMGQRGQTLTQERLDALKREVAGQWVDMELLTQDAKAQNIKVDEKTVETGFAGYKAQFPSEDEFKKWMDQQKITPQAIKDDLRKNFMRRGLIEEKVIKDVKVTEAEAKKFYDENRKNGMFDVPEMIHAKHIILRLEPTATEEQKAVAKGKMGEIQAKLKAGQKFEDLASQYGEDSTKTKGGDLGLQPRGALVKEFEEAALALKPGQVSGVVTTQFGLHLIKLEEKRPAGIQGFKEIKNELVRGLEMEAKRGKVGKYIAGLKAKAKIQINL